MEESDFLSSISLTSEQTQKILDQATSCLCLIKNKNLEVLGFFCLIPYLSDKSDLQDLEHLNNDKLQPILITCNSIFEFNDLKKGNNIKLIYKNEEKIIIIDESRYIYYNEFFDIEFIELKENEFPQNAFLKLDFSIKDFGIDNELRTKYENQEIYLINYLIGKEPKYSLGKIKDINNLFIKNCSILENISLSSPILNLDTFNVIGIYRGANEKAKHNLSTALYIPIFEYYYSKINYKNIKLYNISIDNEPKCVLDLISQKFIKDKNKLLSQLNNKLELAELTEIYKNEVIKKFQYKITKIFDTKKDNNTLINLMSKVRGLPNLVVFCSFRVETIGIPIQQVVYINGKIDLAKNIFSLEKKDSIAYGIYEEGDEQFDFQVFEPQNFQIYFKIKIDSLYLMCYREEYLIKFLIKIKQKFKDNEIKSAREHFIFDKEDDDNEYFDVHEKLIKNKEKVDELFEKQNEIENSYLEELMIYKIDE